MAILSARSRKELATVHPDLRRLMEAVAEEFPVEVICGHRGKVAQNQAFAEKRSKVAWPNSRHNSWPAEAVDVIPREIIQGASVNWNDTAAFKRLAEVVKTTALKLQVDLVWGGDWKSLVDRPHWELAQAY